MCRPVPSILISVIYALKFGRFLSRTTLGGHQNLTPENFTTPFDQLILLVILLVILIDFSNWLIQRNM